MTRRIVYLDANVFHQINSNNQQAARALRQLLASGADVRVSNWTYQELVVSPDIPRSSVANQRMIDDLNITIDPPVPADQRAELGMANQRGTSRLSEHNLRGGPTLSDNDAQVAIGARAGGGELWSFDRTFRRRGPNVDRPATIQRLMGLTIAPESHLPMVRQSVDYRVGRRIMGLRRIEISLSGEIRELDPPGGTGSGGGSGGSAAPRQSERRTRTHQSGAVERRISSREIRRRLQRARPRLEMQRQRFRRTRTATRIGRVAGVVSNLMSAFDAFTAVTDALSLLNGTRLDPEVQAPLDRLRVQARELRNFCKAAGQAFSWIDDDFRTAIRNEILSAAVRRDSTALARTAIELDEISDLLNSVIESIEEAEPGERERSLRRHARAATRASEVFWRWAMAQTDSGHTLDALDKSETLEQLSGDLRTIANIFKESKDSLSTFREILEFVRAQHDSATRNWDRIARLNSDIRGERAARQILEEFGVAPELDDSLFRLIEEIIYTDDQSGIRQARQTIEAFRIALFEGGMDPDRADRIASEFSKWVNR